MTEEWTSNEQASAYGKSLLRGERVLLRAATEDDLKILAEWYVDPEFTTLQSGTYQITSPSETLEQITKWFSNKDARGGGNFVIELIETGEVVGSVNLFGGALPQRAATAAMQVGGASVGKGIGTEALRLLLNYGFREVGLNRIQLEVFAYNSRAVRAYEKAGFVIEGRRRQIAFHDGRFYDDLVMAVLAEDWFAAQG
jgi:RimJ/RimL family protein N-acetyltransferase